MLKMLENCDPRIAVIGLSGRYPGASSPGQLWQILDSGTCVIGGPPSERTNLACWSERWSIQGGFLEDVDKFDPAMFGIAPKDAAAMDPQQRLMLEVTWAACEDAGIVPADLPKRTGVFVGVISGDYGTFAEDYALSGALPLRATDHYQVANRISFHFDLQGPSLAIDTACSSSGVAFHYAVQSLRTGECDLAIVGGVNLFLHASRFAQFRQLNIISDDNVCRPFRSDANGTVYGEGAGVVLLKRFAEAERDNDNIRAKILSTGVNTCGKTPGFTVPSYSAQSRLISDTIAAAGVDPSTITYVEAHGTGTALGDPIEFRGLVEAFQSQSPTEANAQGRTALGSIKGNIGHLESAAAVAGLTKVVLQMEERSLAPSLPRGEINPRIKMAGTQFALLDEALPWSTDAGPLRATLSSFGAGGVNACILLESHETEQQSPEKTQPELFPFSAKTQSELETLLKNFQEWLTAHDTAPRLSQIARTLQCGRTEFNARAAIVADNVDALKESIGLLFSGAVLPKTVSKSEVDASLARHFQSDGVGKAVVGDLLRSGGLSELAALWAAGAKVEWTPDRRSVRPVSLPTYPFDGQRYWLPESSQDVVEMHKAARFLGQKTDVALSETTIYETRLSPTQDGWSAHHRIFDKMIVPGSYFVSLAASAVTDVLGVKGFRLQNLEFLSALCLNGSDEHIVQCIVHANGDEESVEISGRSDQDETWDLHFRAVLQRSAGSPDLGNPELAVTPHPVDKFYEDGRALGFDWTGPFRGLTTLGVGPESAVGDIAEPSLQVPNDCIIHPATLDACFQVCLASLNGEDLNDGEAFMPFSVGSVTVLDEVRGTCVSEFHGLSRGSSGAASFEGVVRSYDGRPALIFSALTTLKVKRGADGLPVGVMRPAETKPSAEVELLEQNWQPYDLQAGPRLQKKIALFGSGADAARTGVTALGMEIAEAGDADAVIVSIASSAGITQPQDISAMLEAELAQIRLGLEAVRLSAGARLWAVTHGRDDTGHAQCLAAHALAGLCRSLALEHPLFWGGLVDLPRVPDRDALSRLMDVVFSGTSEDSFRICGRTLFVERLVPAAPQRPAKVVISRDCRYIVTGGAGGLGRLHVAWLAEHGARHIEVFARSEPGSDALAFFGTLRERGVSVTVHLVDVTDRTAVSDIVAKLAADGPAIKGVIHTAGRLEDGAFERLDWSQFASVLAPKLIGYWNLATSVADMSLDFLAVTSSATSHLGAPGQTNYGMANAVLRGVTRSLRAMNAPAVCVDWGPWAATGMTARIDSARAEVTSGASAALHPDHANQVFDLAYLPGPGDRILLPSHWRHGASVIAPSRKPSLWREGLPNMAIDDVPAVSGRVIENPRDAVEHAINTALGYGADLSFDWATTFQDLGLDSLSAVAMRDQLVLALGIRLDATLAFDYPTPSAVLEHVTDVLNGKTRPEHAAVASNDASDVMAMSESQVDALLEEELADLAKVGGLRS